MSVLNKLGTTLLCTLIQFHLQLFPDQTVKRKRPWTFSVYLQQSEHIFQQSGFESCQRKEYFNLTSGHFRELMILAFNQEGPVFCLVVIYMYMYIVTIWEHNQSPFTICWYYQFCLNIQLIFPTSANEFIFKLFTYYCTWHTSLYLWIKFVIDWYLYITSIS